MKNLQKRTPKREEKIRRIASYRQKDLSLVLSNIHDPHNVSAIYRSCDAFGVAKVHLHYTNTAFPKLGEKSSASARKWVESVRHSNMEQMVAELQAKKFTILATSCSPNAQSLYTYDLTKPTCFILGNEHSGVEENFLTYADGEVFIPMFGMIQSFNVSVAAALLLGEAARQRIAKGMYDIPSYPALELEELISQWSQK